jgi:hypothetical protein
MLVPFDGYNKDNAALTYTYFIIVMPNKYQGATILV